MNSVNQCIQELRSCYDTLAVIDCDQFKPNSHEFYLAVKQQHRESFNNDQRIVFTITSDYHRDHAGLRLQALQVLINDIDISNFFVCIVTTNSNINQDYEWVLHNVSKDTVPVTVYQCTGEYTQLSADGMITQTKASSFELVNELQQHSPQDQVRLFDSKIFCMLPWTSQMISSDSTVQACCWNSSSLGDCSKNTLEEIWNSEATKNMRLDMLADRPVKGCQQCYDFEHLGRDSLRTSSNRSMSQHVARTNTTDQTGAVAEHQLNYWDIRFNNLCNLACRMCYHGNSSSWHQPAVALGLIPKTSRALLIAGRDRTDIYQQFMQHIDHVDKIYFAGGEPLMISECYDILQQLILLKRTDVELVYNTNFTRTQLQGKNIFDYWKHFDKVSVGASLDATGNRGEYLRPGTVWDDVVKNRKLMLEQCPSTEFSIASTVTIVNALHLPDFHRDWVEQGFIQPGNFTLQLLVKPSYLSLKYSPPELRSQILDRYQQHIKWLQPLDQHGKSVQHYQSVITMLADCEPFDAENFWINTAALDNYHQNNLLSAYPELSILPKVTES